MVGRHVVAAKYLEGMYSNTFAPSLYFLLFLYRFKLYASWRTATCYSQVKIRYTTVRPQYVFFVCLFDNQMSTFHVLGALCLEIYLKVLANIQNRHLTTSLSVC